MKSLCYVNGEIKPAEEGVIGISDLSVQRGYGVFDYGRTYNGKLFHFEENLKRFRSSASELHMVPPVSDMRIREIAEELIEGSDLRTPAVRMILTGGYSETLDAPNFIIIAEELPTYPNEIYEEGVRIIKYEYQRELPHIKSINYLNAIRLEPLKRERNASDILYHSAIGITECPRNNFFVFMGDTLVTPSDGVLHGVTRNIVLKLAAPYFRVEERRVDVEELGTADEAFVTSTTKGVLPVTEIDDSAVGEGKVGERSRTLMRLLDEYTRKY